MQAFVGYSDALALHIVLTQDIRCRWHSSSRKEQPDSMSEKARFSSVYNDPAVDLDSGLQLDPVEVQLALVQRPVSR